MAVCPPAKSAGFAAHFTSLGSTTVKPSGLVCAPAEVQLNKPIASPATRDPIFKEFVTALFLMLRQKDRFQLTRIFRRHIDASQEPLLPQSEGKRNPRFARLRVREGWEGTSFVWRSNSIPFILQRGSKVC